MAAIQSTSTPSPAAPSTPLPGGSEGAHATRSGVEAIDLWKCYRAASRTVEALRGVTVRFPAVGFHAVMGPSGSGKSTLLHLLAGLDRVDRGDVVVGGQSLAQMTEEDLTRFRRRGVGVVFQQFNLLPTMTALENAMLPGILDGADREAARARAASLLEALGVADRASHRPEALSGGEQQRVAIARALHLAPPVLLADEPTGNLDSASSRKLWTLLRETAERHRLLVLMVTHEPEAAAHCESTTILRDGRVSCCFPSYGLDSAELAHRASGVGG